MTPALFSAYRAARDANDADLARRYLGALIIQAEHLIKRQARYIARGEGDYDDLMQAGRMALAKAIEAYDPTRGSFETFAWLKIKDAFDLEVVSRRPLVPATARWRETKTSHGLCKMPQGVKRAERAFLARTGKEATAEDLGVDADDLSAWRAKTTTGEYEENHGMNVDDPDPRNKGKDGVVEAVFVAAVQDVSHAVSRKVRLAIGDLSPQEQRVFFDRVFEELDFAVIGKREGLLRDAVTRVFTTAVAKLRVAIGTP